MSDQNAPRGPRVILEDDRPAPRLDFQWEQAVVPVEATPKPRVAWSGIGRVLGGGALLVGGIALIDAVNFIQDQFARGPVEGLVTTGIVGGGLALLLSGIWREFRGLASIRNVDHARAAFARGDLAAARAEALRWAGTVPEGAGLAPAIKAAKTVDELQLVLQPAMQALETRAAALGRSAAMQAFAVTAISPSPGLDAVIFTWRGVRLVRQVAALHGLRPGLFGTLSLLRRTLWDAATVAATDVVLDAGARALLSNPLLQHVAGEVGAGAVAVRRILRLAKVSAEACRITPTN